MLNLPQPNDSPTDQHVTDLTTTERSWNKITTAGKHSYFNQITGTGNATRQLLKQVSPIVIEAVTINLFLSIIRVLKPKNLTVA